MQIKVDVARYLLAWPAGYGLQLMAAGDGTAVVLVQEPVGTYPQVEGQDFPWHRHIDPALGVDVGLQMNQALLDGLAYVQERLAEISA